MNLSTEKAIFAAGCFWGVQDAFDSLPGVVSTRVGYTGGRMSNPTYDDVCTDTTEHAEAVEVIFDPSKISYADLVDVFWEIHDPTQLNKQGPDFGSQYRSAIFYCNAEQKRIAMESKDKEQKRLKDKIVTQITKATEFYPAEEYHQHYNKKRGRNSAF